jgi:membrane-associated phospholipid phosphatase
MPEFWIRTSCIVLLAIQISGCNTLPNGHRWGEDVAFPDWERIKTVTWNAAWDPETWVPLAGAMVLSVGDLDEDLSDWATRETPLFGSESSAKDASDNLRTALAAATIVSLLSTPSGPNAPEWMTSKFKGALVEASAFGVTGGLTNALKDVTDRERPNKQSDNSFPSLHASEAYSYATLTARNINALNLSPESQKMLRISAKTMAAATAWARIEANKHYPTDVLAGAALGHFVTTVIHDSFMGLDDSVHVGVILDSNDGGILTLNLGF